MSTGGNQFVPVHAPLGCSSTGLKYIRPVPPTFVTEYEEKFQWPPAWAYNRNNVTLRDNWLPRSPTNPPPTVSPTPSQWKILQEVADKLLEKGYEKKLMEALKSPLADRRLSLALEYVTCRLQDDIAAADVKLGENGSSSGPSEEVLDLCKKFMAAVKAIKSM